MRLRFFYSVGAFLMMIATAAAQAPTPQAMNTIRRLAALTPPDQRQVRQWAEATIQELAARISEGSPWTDVFNQYRSTVLAEFANVDNTAAFKAQVVAQFGEVAAEWFGRANTAPGVSRTLARLLADFAANLQPEAVAGLLPCLKSTDAAARYLCATGLAKLQRDFVSDKERLDRVVSAIREAGAAESDAVVLWELYRVLAVPAAQTPAAFEAYFAIFDKRLLRRQSNNTNVDSAEADAFDYFRKSDVQAALSNDQKGRLVRAIASFLALDAERYNASDLEHNEIEALERRMVSAEDALRGLAPGGEGGRISDALSQHGYAGRQQVIAEVYKWIGDARTNTAGALNKAPWNLPAGGS